MLGDEGGGCLLALGPVPRAQEDVVRTPTTQGIVLSGYGAEQGLDRFEPDASVCA